MDGFVPPISGVELWINIAVFYVLLILKIYAFANSLFFSAQAYDAAGKLNKPTWCALLGVAVALQLVPIPIALINLVMTVVALVYLADVKPALSGLRRR